ncbi:MAG: aminotransferase class I/II-fold pyridoxal phosphate-dependent enzyme [Bacilli bacterium]|nr:aminotransferase class I/II-fold pyridoxal phosphate-dependent enzyme [Bacilli bacterium]
MSKDQNQKPLFDALINYGLRTNVTPFDVPGHKMGRGIHQDFKDAVGAEIFKIDVNSMKELDNLSNPTGIIKEAEDLAADLFGADYAFFLVNGSTGGVQNMILSACHPGDKIILPRNVHKSAINGLVLAGAKPVYIQPLVNKKIGISMGISLKDVKRTIDENLDAKAILVLNPTYYGFTSNLKKIIQYAHSKNIAVLVDESHGSHFYFDDRFPEGSIRLGADLATISVHKTGGSLTQSSMLLGNEGLISRAKVRSIINVMQTSSASYLLLGSLDMARYNLATNSSMFENIVSLSNYARDEINKIPYLSCVDANILNGNEIFARDLSKLIINVSQLGLTGFEAYDILKQEYHIQLEVGETKVVLAIVSVGDTMDSIQQLVTALQDFAIKYKTKVKNGTKSMSLREPVVLKTPREAFFLESEYVSLDDAVNKIAADQIMVYPPGIPLVVPGELMTEEIVNDFRFLLKFKNQIIGPVMEHKLVKVKVLKEGQSNGEK